MHELIDCTFISEHDRFITLCILKYAKPPIDDYRQDIYVILCSRTFHNGNVQAYIAKVVQNYFYGRYRKKQITFKEKYIPSVTIPSDSHLIYKDVLTKIDHLPHGECLKLYSVGYKYREIAEKLNISLSSVKTTIYRLRCKLHKNT